MANSSSSCSLSGILQFLRVLSSSMVLKDPCSEAGCRPVGCLSLGNSGRRLQILGEKGSISSCRDKSRRLSSMVLSLLIVNRGQKRMLINSAKEELQRWIIQIMLKDKDSKQSIRVTIRVRPLSDKQKMDDLRECVSMEQSHSLSLANAGQVKKFTFDSISYEQSQQEIFERVGRRCAQDCLEGYNCTIFAYGQTGAGKTYTMMGVNADHHDYELNRGLIPRTIKYLFECIDEERAEGINFVIRCSFLEIYNEQIIDLLNKNNTNLQLREDTRKGVYVEGITEELLGKSEEIMDLLHKGSKSRHVGSTYYNETSSRSHSVFTMNIESKYTKNGVVNRKSRQFNFIDLAGSERTKMNTGERLKEGCNINKSLMNLASVINALSEVSEGKTQHVNYRNSKLTFLLKDSLGGNSKTNLIANISPSSIFYQETLSTLSFARRAKLIKRQKASINEDSSGNIDSMKNEIKRLKQEVIILMGRLQSEEGTKNSNPTSSTPQMTSIMHQYVAEEIDKQTRLEMELLKLKERISYLQDGIKHYSSSQTHLRMIIAVLEDKITRLKAVETILSSNLDEVSSDEEKVESMKDYFDKEREGLLKQVEAFKGQSEGTRIIKELLKHANIMKDDGEEEETLKDLLTKNTNFLSMIHTRLEEIAPEKQQSEFNVELERKVGEIEADYHKKEEENFERMEQLSLELTQARSRIDENDKMLEEAITCQIMSEQKIQSALEEKEETSSLLRQQESKRRSLEEEFQNAKRKNEDIIQQLKNEVSNKEIEDKMVKKQTEGFKVKIEKLMTNQKFLKEEFDSLEEEKYKLDKIVLQNIEEIKEQKNALMKAESQITIFEQKIEVVTKENKEMSKVNEQLTSELLDEKKNNKFKLEELQKTHSLQTQTLEGKEKTLTQEVDDLEAKLKLREAQLGEQTEELDALTKKFTNMENEMNKEVEAKELQLKEMTSLINQKEENGSEVQSNLNQVKLQLINVSSEKERNQGKLKKTIEELKEKVIKEHQNFEQLQIQANQRANLYQQLTKEQSKSKKTVLDLTQKVERLLSLNEQLTIEVESMNSKNDLNQKEIDSIRQMEKGQRVTAMEMKNQLFVVQKNAEIQSDAIRSQLSLKEQQLEKIDKEYTKFKLKNEKEMEQIQKELEKSQQMFEEHETSLKKSMESHLLSKENQLSEVRTLLSEKEHVLKQNEIVSQEEQSKIQQLQSLNESQQGIISEQKESLDNLQAQIEQMKMQSEESMAQHEKQIEESEVVHNKQLDQKTEQLEVYMIQNETLGQEVEHLKLTMTHDQETLLQERKEKAILEVAVTTMESRNIDLSTQLQDSKASQSELQTQKAQLQEQIYKSQSNKEGEIQSSLQTMKKLLGQHEETEKSMKEEEKQTKDLLCVQSKERDQLLQQLVNEKKDTQALKLQINESLLQQDKLNDIIKSRSQEFEGKQIELNDRIESLQTLKNSSDDEKTEKISSLEGQLAVLKNNIEVNEETSQEVKQKLNDSNKFARDLSKALESEKLEVTHLQAYKKSLEDQNKCIVQDKKRCEAELNSSNEEKMKISHEVDKLIEESKESSLTIEQLSKKIVQKDTKQAQIDQRLSDLEDEGKQSQQASEEMRVKLLDEESKNGSLSNELLEVGNIIKALEVEKNSLKDIVERFESDYEKLTVEYEEYAQYKDKWQLQTSEVKRMNTLIEEEQLSKDRLYEQVCRERENNDNYKLIIENSEAQTRQLEVELEEKDSIYKKLLEKIAKNDNESKKTSNSEHYLKTIELLERSRADQLELRRQTEDLKKANTNLKEALQEKESYIKEVEKKSQGYCVSMHKRLEQIQKDYFQLERSQQRLIKEKKTMEKCSNQNSMLKDQIRSMKANANKMMQKQEQLESRFKKCNIDYIELEKEFEELKKGQFMINTHDDKTNYINRLKAEVAALKTEKVLLTDSLNREREEKTKFKAEMRFGKDGSGDLGGKIELEKKVNENKNLQELIFEIVSHLKICVNEPRTKLETIRSVILGTIKQKNSEVKSLRERVKQFEDHQQAKHMMIREPALKDYKGENYSHLKAGGNEDQLKYEKEKDPTILDNNSRQKMKEFQNHYAKFKHTEKMGKYKNT